MHWLPHCCPEHEPTGRPSRRVTRCQTKTTTKTTTERPRTNNHPGAAYVTQIIEKDYHLTMMKNKNRFGCIIFLLLCSTTLSAAAASGGLGSATTNEQEWRKRSLRGGEAASSTRDTRMTALRNGSKCKLNQDCFSRYCHPDVFKCAKRPNVPATTMVVPTTVQTEVQTTAITTVQTTAATTPNIQIQMQPDSQQWRIAFEILGSTESVTKAEIKEEDGEWQQCSKADGTTWSCSPTADATFSFPLSVRLTSSSSNDEWIEGTDIISVAPDEYALFEYALFDFGSNFV